MHTPLTRFAVASAGALTLFGMTACGGGSAPKVSAAASTSSSSSSTPPPAASSSSSTPSTPSQTPSSSLSSSSSSDTSPQATGAKLEGCSTTLTPTRTTLKFGQPAVFKDSNDATICLAPTKLSVAPDSVYDDKILKSNGTVYFLQMNYGTAATGSRPVKARDINNLIMHPTVAKGATGKAFYSDFPGCDQSNDDNTIAVGKSEKTCIAYQITGAKTTEVIYSGYPEKYRWQ